MQLDQTIIKLIMDASVLVKIIMLILVLASISSWTIIFIKRFQLTKAQRQVRRFEDQFWSGASLKQMYTGLREKQNLEGIQKIFFAGYQEFSEINSHALSSESTTLLAAQRSMRIAESRELDRYEHHLSFLATVGSTSPYIGLFGTVWGIMNSFIAIGQMKQATLAVVAPGIAEALIATAFGLFAAIPAVIAYNKYSDSVDRLAVTYENFREEFVALLERHLMTSNEKQGSNANG